ncbi:MAG: nitrogen fixation protein NifQ [Methylomonas sp.]|jgi:nitrogen fixation protein NifQ|uniref:nitrogen fixation protein NifQ n=1 Tax=Methylomonas sp. TaxID=418 RepID=UPI0025E65406|nr:nitrogen fixation protein NifQ [Methylomonas sp.]MCK9605605.1 nitrogen fixation protein NifQ [Methylomonas sp.]
MQAQVKIPAVAIRQQHYSDLVAGSDGSANSVWLAQIIASWLVGEGALPDRLGLSDSQFRQLLRQQFSGHAVMEQAPSGSNPDFSRMLEKQDLEQLLRQSATAEYAETEWLITIIVAACLGSDHLWQDLGLWSRKELSAMLIHNFPQLAERNSKDMKWKKFLYKQLCEAEGLFVCRAPSCEVCQDYPQCFGPED